MDYLSDLPASNHQHTAEDEQIMNMYFGENSTAIEDTDDSEDSDSFYKKMGYIVVVFAILCAPLLDSAVLSRISYLSNDNAKWGVKVVLFAVVLFLIEKYL